MICAMLGRAMTRVAAVAALCAALAEAGRTAIAGQRIVVDCTGGTCLTTVR